MRPVDGDRLKQVVQQWIDTLYGVVDVETCEIVLNLIDVLPTLTPQNEALTLEQLREMDGEPVWIEDVKHWALIDIEKGGQWDGVPFAVWAENGVKFIYNVESRDLHCYRRPPEGEGST